MNKTISVIRQSDHNNSGYVQGTMSERISLVWSLTCEAVSLGKKYDVEQRLQRHITKFFKQKSKNKLSTGRTKDLADAQALEEIER
jgi:hypothetical protein